MATIKLKSEKRLKQVDTSAESAATYESGDVVYDSDGNKFRTSNGTAWSDLTVPATVSDIGSIANVDAIGSNANRGKFLKVKSGADEIEYVDVTVPGAIGDLSDVAAVGSNANRGKFLKVSDSADTIVYVDENYMRSPMFTDQKAIANGASAHVNIEGDLNAGDGGILTVKNDQAAASGAAPGTYGVSVNTANLTADPATVKYEILASDNKQFKFAAVTTAIDSFSGQAQIGAGSDVTVTDSQKLVLAYTGTAWKYSVQSR